VTPATSARRYRTPPTVARELAVNVSKVLCWIRSGQLVAINVVERLGGRPRWRIAIADLEAFLASRTARPATKTTRRRRKADPQVIEFF